MTVSIIPNPKDRITDLLTAYGSDVTRWPADQVHVIENLSAEQHSELFRNDEALDRVLARAREAEDAIAPSDALLARIISARRTAEDLTCDRNSTTSSASAVVVSIELTTRAAGVSKRPSQARERAAIAALLAASLVLGIYFGSTDMGRVSTVLVGDLAGISVTPPDVQTSALDEALQLNDDEGIL
jgi:hypothetical protein